MTRPTQPRDWYSHDLTAPITGKATPPASAALLVEADAWPVAAAVTPYCGTARIFDASSDATLLERYLAQVVAPGAVHGRAAITRRWQLTVNTGSPSAYHELWSSEGGTTGADVIQVGGPLSTGGFIPESTFKLGGGDIIVSSGGVDDTPSAAGDRAIELQTSGAPTVEPLYVTQCAGLSIVVSDLVADLETL